MLEGSDRVNDCIYDDQSFSSYISTYRKAVTELMTTFSTISHSAVTLAHTAIQSELMTAFIKISHSAVTLAHAGRQ